MWILEAVDRKKLLLTSKEGQTKLFLPSPVDSILLATFIVSPVGRDDKSMREIRAKSSFAIPVAYNIGKLERGFLKIEAHPNINFMKQTVG